MSAKSMMASELRVKDSEDAVRELERALKSEQAMRKEREKELADVKRRLQQAVVQLKLIMAATKLEEGKKMT
jgi:uncharacterized Ntn-hydrolase superfamily protein